MIFFNSIINAKGTPSVYEDTLANRPSASTIGRLFVRTDNPYGIYRDQGTSWQLITGSGGGGSQDLNSVLSNGGLFSTNYSSNLYNFGWELYNLSYFKIKNYNNQFWNFSNSSLKYFNASNVNTLFSIDYTTGDCAFGDFSSQYNGTHMYVNVSGNQIYFAPSNYLIGLFQLHKAILGDGFNSYNTTQFIVDDEYLFIQAQLNGSPYLQLDFNSRNIALGDIDGNYDSTLLTVNYNNAEIYLHAISSIFLNSSYINLSSNNSLTNFYIENGLIVTYFDTIGSNAQGLKVDYQSSFIAVGLGDYLGLQNSTYITIYDEDQSMVLRSDNGISLTTNFLSFNGSVLSGSSGSTSGQHLVVTINGQQYKIQLRNP